MTYHAHLQNLNGSLSKIKGPGLISHSVRPLNDLRLDLCSVCVWGGES